MTTKEYLDSLDRECKALEIRAILADSKREKNTIKETLEKRRRLQKNLRRVFNRHTCMAINFEGDDN